MEPIAGSYRIRCRMFSSCLTCSAVSPLYSSGGTTWRCASALLAITDVMLMSCGCRAAAGCLLIGSLASRLCPSPRLSTWLAGRGAGVAVACFFRISTVCCSRHPVAGCADLLACSDVRRSVPSCCMLCADFVDRVRCGCRGCFAMVY